MRIIWHSNAPWARTGYGNQTMLFAKRIQDMGHEIAITAFYGLEGGVLNWDGIPVYPRAYHPYGNDVMAAHATHFKADVIISLIDAWVMEPSMPNGMRWAPWFPVDHDPIPKPVRDKVARAWRRLVYSRFAEQQVNATGLDCIYVPHGVDTKKYRPIDRVAAREQLRWPNDKFIVGMVAANKGNPSRKAFVENIGAFALLKRKHPDAMLYLHTVAGEENGGPNLPAFIESLGLSYGFYGRCDPAAVDVLFNDQYQALIGLSEDYMNAVYNAMDVHTLATMGEGFGIPLIEAQAAGCPVIVGDWTATPELCFSGWKVAKDEAVPFWTPMASWQFIPRREAIAKRMEAAYRVKDSQGYRDRAHKGAQAYAADLVAKEYWQPALDAMWEEIKAWGQRDEPGHQWIGVGLYNPDGTMDIPEKVTGDALRVHPDGKQEIIPGGFTNPLGLQFVDPDGLEWLLMREVERDYGLESLALNPGAVVVDIGAHVGVVSMSLAKRFGCTVYAYEPEPDNYRRLISNVAANKLGDKIMTFPFAATRDSRLVSIGGGGQNSGGHSIYKGVGPQVQSTTLAEIIENVGGRIDLLKIDAEGAEYEILEGADLSAIGAIRGEFHGPQAPAFLEKIKALVPDTKVSLQGVRQ